MALDEMPHHITFGLASVDRAIAKMITHYDRWQYLELIMPSACAQPVFAKLSEGSALLKFLRVMMMATTTDNNQLTIDLSRQVVLSGLTLYTTRTQFMINHATMQNVRTLEMVFSTIHDCFLCLDLCPSAHNVYFRFHDTVDFRPSGSQAIRILPSIRTLSLQIWSGSYDLRRDIGPFLDCLQLPRLGELDLCPTPLPETLEPWRHMSDLLERSNPPLESLKVKTLIPMDEFWECLRKAPGLEVLLAVPELFSNPTLDNLTRGLDSEQPFVCPRLKQIELAFCDHASCEDAAELVLRRWYGTGMDTKPSHASQSSRICSVLLLISKGNQVDSFLYYPGIRQCIRDGLSVTSCDRQFHTIIHAVSYEAVYKYDHSKFSQKREPTES
ncbi:hypothetical protein BD410DRAFT_825716 [Rickenella mellea]|uniref:F-box domain-containing protein n=1 Tax=Rickenella mellea TaxID=50990 RepID=A0A4Y7QI69_9AGAM|nr:hypothetical protein BD410DRAFT_825716 [Rickenella mellea]